MGLIYLWTMPCVYLHNINYVDASYKLSVIGEGTTNKVELVIRVVSC